MAYLPDAIPGPEPSIDDAPFWEFCEKGELRFQRCGGCSRHRMPPSAYCPHCHSREVAWVRAPETGEVFSFTVVHHAAHPDIHTALPYNVAIVIFPECDNVRLISNVIDAGEEEMTIGMPVKLVWETAGNGRKVPRFRKT